MAEILNNVTILPSKIFVAAEFLALFTSLFGWLYNRLRKNPFGNSEYIHYCIITLFFAYFIISLLSSGKIKLGQTTSEGYIYNTNIANIILMILSLVIIVFMGKPTIMYNKWYVVIVSLSALVCMGISIWLITHPDEVKNEQHP